MPENNQENVSQHILPTSSTLLGFCFILIGSIKALGLAHKTILDDITAIGIIVFLFASLFSYASIRNKKKAVFYEKIADTIFMLGLALLSVISFLLVFDLI
ncbi:MAG: hypothetical protein BMS9Abin23_0761 [Thermodesulfobacteriota bacterium]|nr:MAG: hypothetical protein BMS9Abin23_0761 [Thermodesulfobacteriota bacterium]